MRVVHTRVFALEHHGGNPAAIVLDADGLTVEQMQSLAMRFGHETGFILTPSRSGMDVRLRYFVPAHEMEMCVHATVGAATVLAQQNELYGSSLNVETPLGPIAVELASTPDRLDVTVEQFAPKYHVTNPKPGDVASVLGIPPAALDSDVGPIQSVSTSRPKLMVAVRDHSVLDDVRPRFEALWSLCHAYRTTGVYVFTVRPRRGDLRAEARQFPVRAGYHEDPATGVAACALGAYLARYGVFGRRTTGWQAFRIGQGFCLGRPSVLTAECFVEQGSIIRTRVVGAADIDSEEVLTADVGAEKGGHDDPRTVTSFRGLASF